MDHLIRIRYVYNLETWDKLTKFRGWQDIISTCERDIRLSDVYHVVLRVL
jgi:hypothetical protein